MLERFQGKPALERKIRYPASPILAMFVVAIARPSHYTVAILL
jgi:hypothetical protein